MMVATVLLSIGVTSITMSYLQCNRLVRESKARQTAQQVLNYGEMLYPLPDPDKVSDDPLKNEQLNIPETKAENITKDLELELPRSVQEELEGFVFERTVDEIDEETLQRNSNIYTVRTKVRWGTNSDDGGQEEVISFWRKR